MSRTVLMLVGIILVLMGIAGLIPSWTIIEEAAWLAVAEIVIGAIAVVVAISDKKAE